MSKYDLEFSSPLINAAGSLGFAADFKELPEGARLGAFITNPVSRKSRFPVRGTRLFHFSGGILLHSGHPNPGLASVLRKYSERWERSPIPVLVHLLFEGIESANDALLVLENSKGVSGVELGIPRELDDGELEKFVNLLSCELPLIIRLPIEKAESLSIKQLRYLSDKFTAISLGPGRGTLTDTGDQFVSGRMYGPALFPRTLAATIRLCQAGIKIIAGGGVYRKQQVDLLLRSGAIAVQLDTVLWRGGLIDN